MYAIKLELKLNNKERSMLAGCSGFKRVVYNFGLELLKNSWQFEDIKASDSKRLAAIKKILTNDVMTSPEYEWMKIYPSTVYQSALQDLKDAFDRWRKGLADIPVFKAKKDGDSFTVYRTSGIYPEKGKPALPFTNRQVLYPGQKITIPGLGEFRLKEKLKYLSSSQTFTISRQANKWFVSFVLDAEIPFGFAVAYGGRPSCSAVSPPIFHEVVEPVGIDLGVKCLATLSDGQTYEAPKPFKKAKIKLAKIQWRNRRKQLGNRKPKIRASKNADKFYASTAKVHAKIANTRRDYLQKLTTEIGKKYARIAIENLNVSGMIANHKLSAAISDVGFYEFRRMLEYKQPIYGCKVELVDMWFPSSKTCSKCGCIKAQLSLSERVFQCTNCGFELDRDLNAAINLSKYVPMASREFKPVDKKEPTPLVEAGSQHRIVQ